MEIANQSAKRDKVGNGLDLERGIGGRGDVIKHFQRTSDDQNQHEENGGSARAQCITPARLCGWNGGRVQVVEEVGAHGGERKDYEG